MIGLPLAVMLYRTRYAAWQATQFCVTFDSAATAASVSWLAAARVAAAANSLAAVCIDSPRARIGSGMKTAIISSIEVAVVICAILLGSADFSGLANEPLAVPLSAPGLQAAAAGESSPRRSAAIRDAPARSPALTA